MPALEGELGVNLVGEHQYIVPQHHRDNRLQVLLFHNGPGGVVGVGEDQELGAGGDGRLQGLRGQAEAILRPGDNGDGDAPRQPGDGVVADKAGLRNKHLVSGVQAGPDAQVDGLASPHRHQHLPFLVGEVKAAGQVGGNLPAQLQKPGVGGVPGAALFQGFDARPADGVGGLEVRLPHPQGDDPLHGGGQVKEPPDAGGLQLLGPPGKDVGVIHQPPSLSSFSPPQVRMPPCL